MTSIQTLKVGHRLRRQFYLDSVALMRLSRQLVSEPGVDDAALMMASPVNIEIMQNAGLLPPGCCDAKPADLVIAIAANSETALAAAFNQADNLLDSPSLSPGAAQATAGGLQTVASLREATNLNPQANLALISVPGSYAAAEAAKAIATGMNTMIFSDNVALEDEVSLKQQALEHGVLVMGPDCGTAILGGVPLAFANRVPRGSVGIVGASGTGIQEVTCLLAHRNIGISHAIGVGGRDLSAEVGGLTTLQAIDLLGDDENTRLIVLISKPPAVEIRNLVLEKIAGSSKAAIVCFVGDTISAETPMPDGAGLTLTSTLEETVFAIARELGVAEPAAPSSSEKTQPVAGNSPRQFIRGLYCGGTLCAEAQVILRAQNLPVSSNAAIPGATSVSGADTRLPAAHSILDLGADEFTLGKPHPMIETSTRDEWIEKVLADPATCVVLLDCVIGFGAHADPASGIVAALDRQRKLLSGTLPVVVASVTGTDQDTQNRSKQIAILEAAGVRVRESNAAATREALLAAGL